MHCTYVLYLQLLRKKVLAGSRKDRHELLKREKGITLLKLNGEVCKVFDVRHKGCIMVRVEPDGRIEGVSQGAVHVR